MEYADAHADEVEVRVVEGIYDVSDIEPTSSSMPTPAMMW